MKAEKIFSALVIRWRHLRHWLLEIWQNHSITTFANNHISLEIEAAKITAFLGHNGAGDPTLLNQMIGLQTWWEMYAMETFLLYRIVNKLAQWWLYVAISVCTTWEIDGGTKHK